MCVSRIFYRVLVVVGVDGKCFNVEDVNEERIIYVYSDQMNDESTFVKDQLIVSAWEIELLSDDDDDDDTSGVKR